MTTYRSMLPPPCTSAVFDYRRYIGEEIAKVFPGHGRFTGKVAEFDPRTCLFLVVYSDGDSEELTVEQLNELLGTVPAQTPLTYSQTTTTFSDLETRKRVRGIFDKYIYPVLQKLGWRTEIGCSPHEQLFIPPNVDFRTATLGRDFFNSPEEVVTFVWSHPELKAYCLPSEYSNPSQHIPSSAIDERQFNNQPSNHYQPSYPNTIPIHGSITHPTQRITQQGVPSSLVPSSTAGETVRNSVFGEESYSSYYARMANQGQSQARDNRENQGTEPLFGFNSYMIGASQPMPDRNLPVLSISTLSTQEAMHPPDTFRSLKECSGNGYPEVPGAVSVPVSVPVPVLVPAPMSAPKGPMVKNALLTTEPIDVPLLYDGKAASVPSRSLLADQERAGSGSSLGPGPYSSISYLQNSNSISSSSSCNISSSSCNISSSSSSSRRTGSDCVRKESNGSSSSGSGTNLYQAPQASGHLPSFDSGRPSTMAASFTLTNEFSNSPSGSTSGWSSTASPAILPYPSEHETAMEEFLNAPLREFREKNPGVNYIHPSKPEPIDPERVDMYKDLVQEFYIKFCIRDTSKVEEVLRVFKGREGQLLKELKLKYCPEESRVWEDLGKRWEKSELNRERALMKAERLKALLCQSCGKQCRNKNELELHASMHSKKDFKPVPKSVDLVKKKGAARETSPLPNSRKRKTSVDAEDNKKKERKKKQEKKQETKKVKKNSKVDRLSAIRRRSSSTSSSITSEGRRHTKGKPVKTMKFSAKSLKLRRALNNQSNSSNSSKTPLCKLPMLEGKGSLVGVCTANIRGEWPVFLCTKCKTWFHLYCYLSSSSSDDPTKMKCTACELRKENATSFRVTHDDDSQLRLLVKPMAQLCGDVLLENPREPKNQVVRIAQDRWNKLPSHAKRCVEKLQAMKNRNSEDIFIAAQVLRLIQQGNAAKTPRGMTEAYVVSSALYAGLPDHTELSKPLLDPNSTWTCRVGGCARKARKDSSYCSNACGILDAEQRIGGAVKHWVAKKEGKLLDDSKKHCGWIRDEFELNRLFESFADKRTNAPAELDAFSDDLLEMFDRRKSILKKMQDIEDGFALLKNMLKMETEKLLPQKSSSLTFYEEGRKASEMAEKKKFVASDGSPILEIDLYTMDLRVDAYCEDDNSWHEGRVVQTDPSRGVEVHFEESQKKLWIQTKHLADPAAEPFSQEEIDGREELILEMQSEKTMMDVWHQHDRMSLVYEDYMTVKETKQSIADGEKIGVTKHSDDTILCADPSTSLEGRLLVDCPSCGSSVCAQKLRDHAIKCFSELHQMHKLPFEIENVIDKVSTQNLLRIKMKSELNLLERSMLKLYVDEKKKLIVLVSGQEVGGGGHAK